MNWKQERRYLEKKWGRQGEQIFCLYDSFADDILKYSKKNKLRHIPSALSMSTYIDILFSTGKVKPYRDKITLGKPFGSQTYYLIWQKLNYLKNIEHYHEILKHTEIDFVDFSGEALGNTLGISTGIAMTTKECVWINMSDSAFQMGSELEAMQYIGAKQHNNIFMTVDYNNQQVTGRVDEIVDIKPVFEMLKLYNWDVHVVDGHDRSAISDTIWNLDHSKPTAIFFKTRKGYGHHDMELNPGDWHYKTLQ